MTHVTIKATLICEDHRIHAVQIGWQLGVWSCIMLRLSTHLVQATNVGTVVFINWKNPTTIATISTLSHAESHYKSLSETRILNLAGTVTIPRENDLGSQEGTLFGSSGNSVNFWRRQATSKKSLFNPMASPGQTRLPTPKAKYL